MTREQSYLIIGLKSLGYLKFREKSGRKAVYDCLKCNVRIEKRRVSMHFRFNHSDIYYELKLLIQKWGLCLDSNQKRLNCMTWKYRRNDSSVLADYHIRQVQISQDIEGSIEKWKVSKGEKYQMRVFRSNLSDLRGWNDGTKSSDEEKVG